MRHHFEVGDVVYNTATNLNIHYVIRSKSPQGYYVDSIVYPTNTKTSGGKGWLSLNNQHVFTKLYSLYSEREVLKKAKVIDNKYKITRR